MPYTSPYVEDRRGWNQDPLLRTGMFGLAGAVNPNMGVADDAARWQPIPMQQIGNPGGMPQPISALPSLDELLGRAQETSDEAIATASVPSLFSSAVDPLAAALGGPLGGPSLPTLPGTGAGAIGGPGFPGLGGTMGAAPGGGIPGATGYTGGGTASGGYNQPGPLMNGDPGSLQEYGLDEKALRTVRGATLVKPAIQDLLQIERETGVNVFDGVGGTFRTREQQIAMDPDGDGYGSSGQLVAPPGHSMHEGGRAIDFDTNWLYEHPEVRRALAERGWVNAVSGEPWHWEYQGPTVVKRRSSTSGGGGTGSSSPSSSSSSPSGGSSYGSPIHQASSPTRRRRSTGSSSSGAQQRRRLIREGRI